MANTTPSFFQAQKHQRAFTLLEVSFAIAVFSLFAVGSIYAMTQANRFASNSRYRTLALAAIQQKLDQVMTATWSVNQATPATVLRTDPAAAGTVGNVTRVINTANVQATTTETGLPLNNDNFNSTDAGLGSAFTNSDVQVLDSRKTVITKLADCSGTAAGASSRLLRADVTVTYTYRGKQVIVSGSIMRTSDDF
jgi:prepilin-type N-terminal cleavage/methylation domain-containing protein